MVRTVARRSRLQDRSQHAPHDGDRPRHHGDRRYPVPEQELPFLTDQPAGSTGSTA